MRCVVRLPVLLRDVLSIDKASAVDDLDVGVL